MKKVLIDRKAQELKLADFGLIKDRATIKVFGHDPARLVIVPDGEANNELQASAQVSHGIISDPDAYVLFSRFAGELDEVPFLELSGEYIQFVAP